jgi:hypothetical protein
MYPRGFFGGNLQPQLVRSPPPVGEVQRMSYRYHVDTMAPTANSDLVANPYVENLYSQYVKRSVNTNAFAFREKVLKATLSAFGTASFEIWFTTQYKSPACGDLHKRFLDDTLKFIRTGRREMALETWAALLQITDEGDVIGTYSKASNDYFGFKDNHRDAEDYLVVDTMQRWLSHASGFEDMLGTLHILFGNI